MTESPPPSRPAVLYAAKSTPDEKGSIETQLEDCRRLARAKGLKLASERYDEAASAFKGNRGPGLREALAEVERLQGVLVVQHSDRLARGDGDRSQHLVEYVLWARKAGVRLASVQDPQTFDGMGLVYAALMGDRNHEDSARKSAATKDGKRRAFERGDFPGGPTPDGFESVGDERRLDPARIDVIRLIGDLADEGWGDPSIMRELNRRGERTKAGGAWTRRRIQDLLTNAIYYGGVVWHRGKPDEEVNWNTTFPAPWTREDYERRIRGRGGRDAAKGSNRNPRGRMHTNHALAGLAVCGRCFEPMRPITSTYRRKDGSRRRNYVCRHVKDGTGLCDAPPLDAELIDIHVINELHRYLGDFEAWRDQLISGYSNERERIQREIDAAQAALAEQEACVERTYGYLDLAADEAEAKVAMRAAANAEEECERRRLRLEAAEAALKEVPNDAPTDAMLDFYNELSAAVRGRLEGASTIARVNDALRDIFKRFVLLPARYADEPTLVTPMLPINGDTFQEFRRRYEAHLGAWGPDKVDELPIRPPLRKLQAPSAELAKAQA
jgi:site-specific DNA recombinase